MEKPNIKPPKKSLIIYYVLALGVVILLNALVMPMLQRMSITEVSYNAFIECIDKNIVTEVQVEDTQIYFIATNENGREGVYITGNMGDPELVQRLLNAGVTFGKVIPNEGSPILDFLLGWILPFAAFFVIGQMLSKNLMKKIGRHRMDMVSKSRSREVTPA
jgi:cell division protease FtsH